MIEAKPQDFEAYHWLAPLLVQVDDSTGYETLRGEMTARFGKTRDPLVADRVVRDCLIRP